MINSINTLGLKPQSTAPERFKTNVNINTQVKAYFNSELDTGSIASNIFILKDSNFIYKESEVNISEYAKVEGSLTYKDKTIIFSPKNPLSINSKYLIYMPKGGIRDIKGNSLVYDFVSTFTTESYQSLGVCNIITPANNITLRSLDNINLQDLSSDKYLLQISKVKTFENVVHEEVFDSNIIVKDFNIGDGLYYIRAKALNGEFGDTCVLTIKTHENTVPVDQDIDEDYIWQEYTSESELLLETYPNANSIEINEKTNLLYMKFEGLLNLNDINFYESYVSGEAVSDDIESHTLVDGTYCTIHDKENEETYIIFVPNTL